MQTNAPKMHGKSRLASLFLSVAALCLLWSAAFAAGTHPNVLLILDGSGSMWGKIGDGHKILLARSAIANAIRPFDDKINLGFLAYGHRRRGACLDVELIKKPSPLNAIQFTRLVNRIKPLGKTPITSAIEQAIEPLGKSGGHIILLVDGPENCQRNPCRLITPAFAKAKNLTIHVVAFSMPPSESSTLRCLAKNTGGQFITPKNRTELTKALTTSLNASIKGLRNAVPIAKTPSIKRRIKPELRLSAHLGPKSPPLSEALNWQIIKLDQKRNPEKDLPPWASKAARAKFDLDSGSYRITASYKEFILSKDISLEKGTAKAEKFVFNLSELELPASWTNPDSRSGFGKLLLHTPKTKDQTAATTVIELADKAEKRLIPSGTYKISAVESGEMRTWFIHAAPGQTITLPLWSKMGRISFTLKGSLDKSPLENPLLRIYKLPAAGKKSSVQDEVARSAANNPQFELPIGPYLAVLKAGHAALEKRFIIKEHRQINETLTLPNAALKIEIPNNEFTSTPSVEIAVIKQDKSTRLIAQSSTKLNNFWLSPGVYQITLRFGRAAQPLVKTVSLEAGDAKTVKFSTKMAKISFKISDRDDPVSRHQIFWRLFNEADDLLWQSGKSNPTLTLSPGTYRVRAELGSELYQTRFRIKGTKPRTIDLAGKIKTESQTN